MASHPNKSYTAPKGRATTNRVADGRRRWLSPTMEWILLVVVVIVVIAVIIYFGRNVTSTGGGGDHTGSALTLLVSTALS